MTSKVATMLDKDRVFFTRNDADVDTFDDCCFDCFAKTLLNRIREGDERVQILVLATREVALQITETMRKLAEPISVRVQACVEGTSVAVDKMALANGVHIIVGTPGRVKQMITLKSLLLDAVDLFIMYDFGHLLSNEMREAVSSIMNSLPEDIEKATCSCTPHAQLQLEQFFKETSRCRFCDAPEEWVQRDVPTPESGIDDGGEAVDDGGETINCQVHRSNEYRRFVAQKDCGLVGVSLIRALLFLLPSASLPCTNYFGRTQVVTVCERLRFSEPSEDEPDSANSFAHTRYIMTAIQSVNVERKTVQVLVIAPEIEEVKQIFEELQKSVSDTKILVHACCEQTRLRDDGYVLKNGAHVLIASPQRARDLLRREFLHTKSIQVLVMVKAEELFCAGSRTLLHDITQSMPESVQCVLLSGKELIHGEADRVISPYEKLAQSEPREPVINRRRYINIEVQDDQQTERTDFATKNAAKKTQFEVLCDLYPKLECEKTVIICKWPRKAAWIQEHLAARGYHVVYLVGMKTKNFREEMQKFESSLSGVILITETSANLFKEKEISVVVNYEMPRKVRGYVTRVAPMDLERARTVVNLIKNKREADLMETVQSQYGISIEHYINPHCVMF